MTVRTPDFESVHGELAAREILCDFRPDSGLRLGPHYFTTYLRTAETKNYVALARDVDLRSIVPNAAVVAEIPRCGF